MGIKSRRISKQEFKLSHSTPFKLLIAITAIALTGCSTVNKSVEVVSPNRPVVQESLMAECLAWQPLQNKEYTEGQVLDLLTTWITSYQQCRFKHQELAKFIRANTVNN